MKNEVFKVIIDTDPGVDDAYAHIFALNDPQLDVKLITTVAGNVDLKKNTRNMLHLLDILDKDIPVAIGEPKALERISPTAEFIHSKEGLGGYLPPKTVRHRPIKDNAIEAMYKVIKENPREITILEWAPQTNLGKLILTHPDVIPLIKQIIFMGGSPYGVPGFPDHISFNISCDPEAFKIVLDSNIPLVMSPSDMGRRKAHFTEEYVNRIRETNQVGAFIYQMFSTYWERGFLDKRIASNDNCAYIYLIRPDLFKTIDCDVIVDTEDTPGKTFVFFHKKGNVKLLVDIKRKKFLNLMEKKLHELDNFKLKF